MAVSSLSHRHVAYRVTNFVFHRSKLTTYTHTYPPLSIRIYWKISDDVWRRPKCQFKNDCLRYVIKYMYNFFIFFSNKDDTMTEGAEGCSDHPLASLQLQDVASGGPSSEGQQPESQAEVSALCVSPADDDLDKIIAGEWHGGECKSTCAPQTSSTQTNAIGKREICSKALSKGSGPDAWFRSDGHVSYEVFRKGKWKFVLVGQVSGNLFFF